MSAKTLSPAWWLAAAAATVTASAAVVGLALSGSSLAAAGGNGNGNGNAGTNQPPGKAITVTGKVVGKILLGSPATLNVTINNPNNQAMTITQVTGTIASVTSAGVAGKPTCDKSWFSVGTSASPQTLPKNGTAVVAVPLTLNNVSGTNQDNCKGSTVQFTFTATAEGA